MFFLIIKRILLGLITLIIVSLITFVGTEVLPGDACTTYLEREAYGAALEACYKRLGLDIPAHERYLSWAYNVIQGDFGYSLSGQMPINEVLGPRVKNSMVLASAAIIIGIPIALINSGIVIAHIVIVEIVISGSLSLHRAVIIPNIKANGIPIIIAADARTIEFFILGPKTSLIGICPLKEYPKSP